VAWRRPTISPSPHADKRSHCRSWPVVFYPKGKRGRQRLAGGRELIGGSHPAPDQLGTGALPLSFGDSVKGSSGDY
jgi:hypothetical protein